ncbi:MAG: molybdopterin-guanine dinucleotide biosynthesis protein B [Deltaproteobacteria bacterium RIFOXYC2_FULL_48_10]|nr:MAG: molybdopterin-guanine dinucleotide biosynthesis protein B [Deltaproteobacteria bacterium RIFOXYC2_FULL_48_10]OGR56238.1 MAG: molybdopterin-guanine dinucleotide biosynthesis protein B [Desulfobacula sp. RIFOXYB2_FULL_45_6]
MPDRPSISPISPGRTDIITIVGKSDSGKTTLLEKLIAELTRRGYRIGTVKHAHHGFEMDTEGKDSWRHKKAGAHAVLVITEDKIAMLKDDRTSYIEKMHTYLSGVDIILAEGFKSQKLPKIEIFRTAGGHKEPLSMQDDTLIAFVTDSDFQPDVPLFGLEDIGGLADFIEENHLRK